MSIVRKSPISDVCIYSFDDDAWECSGCILRTSITEFVVLHSTQEVIDHLNRHREADHKVPEYAYERIRDTSYAW